MSFVFFFLISLSFHFIFHIPPFGLAHFCTLDSLIKFSDLSSKVGKKLRFAIYDILQVFWRFLMIQNDHYIMSVTTIRRRSFEKFCRG